MAFKIRGWAGHYEPPARIARSDGPLKYIMLKVFGRMQSPMYRRLMVLTGEQNILSAFGLFCKMCEIAGCECRNERLDGVIRDEHGNNATLDDIVFYTGSTLEVVTFCMDCLIETKWVIAEQEVQELDHNGPSASKVGPHAPPNLTKLNLTITEDKRKEEKIKEEKRKEPASELALAPSQDETPEVVLEQWNLTAGQLGLPKALSLTANRRRSVRQRLKDSWWAQHWREGLAKIKTSGFLLGENDRGWKADLDFFLRPDSLQKILEGKYPSPYKARPGQVKAPPGKYDKFNPVSVRA